MSPAAVNGVGLGHGHALGAPGQGLGGGGQTGGGAAKPRHGGLLDGGDYWIVAFWM